jgi:hypothetical protein
VFCQYSGAPWVGIGSDVTPILILSPYCLWLTDIIANVWMGWQWCVFALTYKTSEKFKQIFINMNKYRAAM